MKNSRRNFLKVAGLSALALGAVKNVFAKDAPNAALKELASGKPVVQGAYSKNPEAAGAKQWAMVIDTRRFTKPEDFLPLINACHTEHNVPTISGNQDVKWLWTDGFDQVFPDITYEHKPEHLANGQFLLLCNHCEDPPCVRVCPTGATYKNAEGLVVMDQHRCIGCRFCMAGCPYGARSFNFQDPQPFVENINSNYPLRTRGVVEKCTFCPERLAVGKMPACVEASEGAIVFGDLNDPNSDVRYMLQRNFVIRRKLTVGTQPSVFYII